MIFAVERPIVEPLDIPRRDGAWPPSEARRVARMLIGMDLRGYVEVIWPCKIKVQEYEPATETQAVGSLVHVCAESCIEACAPVNDWYQHDGSHAACSVYPGRSVDKSDRARIVLEGLAPLL